MTIRFKKDRIEFENGANSYVLLEESGGFGFTGRMAATLVTDIFQGAVSGYTSGGYSPPVSSTIDKFPFATNANATNVGGLTQARLGSVGQSSTVSGYTSGGTTATSPAVTVNTIDKFPFATDASASDVGDLTLIRRQMSGQSSSVSGYTSGGQLPSDVPQAKLVIDKFPFATNGNATNVGNLTQGRYTTAGQSSTVSGYTSGGTPPSTNTIDKFPFATDASASDVGDLTRTVNYATGQSSTVSGYTSGGSSTNIIDKFPFATDANATDVGDLTVARETSAGQSSIVSGYTSGGNTPPPSTNTIDKFPFATDGNATDVGDLTVARRSGAGQQY